MKKSAYFTSLLSLVAFNLYFIWYYHQHRQGFATLVFIYWFQSVIIGVFTFVQLLRMPAHQSIAVTYDDGNGQLTDKQSSGCNAFFFMVHFGGFHLAYLAVIFSKFDGGVDVNFLLLSMGIVLLSELMDFVKKWKIVQTGQLHSGTLLSLPYLRIIPMHLMIFGAAFSNLSDITIFLVLKMVADVSMSLLTNHLYFRSSKPNN